jgi:hypothetical protein
LDVYPALSCASRQSIALPSLAVAAEQDVNLAESNSQLVGCEDHHCDILALRLGDYRDMVGMALLPIWIVSRRGSRPGWVGPNLRWLNCSQASRDGLTA